MIGPGAYLFKRIQNPGASDEKIQTLINKQLMVHLISELDRRTQDVSDLIREPFPEHHDNDTSQEVNPDMKQGQPAIFDLTWDYPMLLAFLTEVFHLHLYNVKVFDILKRLILPLLKIENHPQLHSSRLLLALALTKLKHEILEEHRDEWNSFRDIDSYIIVESAVSNLLSGINRATIAKELSPDCAFLKNGTMGISWIYQELFKLSDNVRFKVEAYYWKNESFKFKETDRGYASFNVARENEGEAFGLLNGLSGILLLMNVNSTPYSITT